MPADACNPPDVHSPAHQEALVTARGLSQELHHGPSVPALSIGMAFPSPHPALFGFPRSALDVACYLAVTEQSLGC